MKTFKRLVLAAIYWRERSVYWADQHKISCADLTRNPSCTFGEFKRCRRLMRENAIAAIAARNACKIA